MIEALPHNLQGARDRALLVMGFAGGFRRSELASLNVEDVAETEDGLVLSLRRSKTDQEGQGSKVALPWGSHPETCPVRSYRTWIAAAGITAGAVFRGVNNRGQLSSERLDANSVARIVKRAARRVGLDPASYAGHSLRAGFCTQAYLNGVPELSIMRQSRHQSLDTVRKYIRDRSLFRDNPAAKLGL
jgi:integrase